MIFYVFTIAVLNFCLGLAVGNNLARHSRQRIVPRAVVVPRREEPLTPPADMAEAAQPDAATPQMPGEDESASADECELAEALAAVGAPAEATTNPEHAGGAGN